MPFCTRSLSTLAVLLALACGGSSTGPAANTVASIDVTPASATLSVGQTRQFAASPRTANGAVITGKSATWQSSSSSVATVDGTGLVRAIAAGTTTITASVEGRTGTATVTVLALPVAAIALSPATVTIVVGGTYPLAASVTDSLRNTLSDRSITWVSSNTAVATVSASGVVTGVAIGTATVTATSEGKSATSFITVTPNAAVTYTVSGRVVEAAGSPGISGARVTAQDVNAATVATTTTDAVGGWSITGISVGSVLQFAVSATGYVSTTFSAQTITSATTLESVPLARTSATNGIMSGKARDASTGSAVASIAVELREGVSNTTGLAAQVTTTAADGSYTLTGVAAGTYTLVMRGAGYVQTSRTVAVAGGGTTANVDLSLSANTTVNQWRIILTWTAPARDLDLYLTLPGAGTSREQIYFLKPGNCAAAPFACLDRDASTAPGPETITISQLGTGTYRLYVHNYNTPSSATDSTLMLSGAQLRVFRGTAQVASYSVPPQAGTLWTVAELDGATGTLTPRNVMTAGAPGDPVMALRAGEGRMAPSGKRDPGLHLP